jgi:hypothetical protein
MSTNRRGLSGSIAGGRWYGCESACIDRTRLCAEDGAPLIDHARQLVSVDRLEGEVNPDDQVPAQQFIVRIQSFRLSANDVVRVIDPHELLGLVVRHLRGMP